jgi:hypothetical protein
MKKSLGFILIIFLISSSLINNNISADEQDFQFEAILTNTTSVRYATEDAIVIPDDNPLFGIIGSYLSCWYANESNKLKPLLIQNKEKLTNKQEMFLDKYFKNKNESLIVLGKHLDTKHNITEFLGLPSEVAIEAAKYTFSSSSTVIIISNNIDDYQHSLTVSPLASYLNIPILIFDDNSNQLNDLCEVLNVNNAIIVGDITIELPGINLTKLESIDEIQNKILTVIKNKFSEINYITITNPSDVIPPYVVEINKTEFSDHISNIKITFLTKEFVIKGYDTKKYNFSVEDGINRIQIYTNITKNNGLMSPIIFLYLYDSMGNLVAYSSSLAYNIGSAYLETLTCNASGKYSLIVNMYKGTKGGYFSQRGISILENDFEITLKKSKLEKAHLAMIPKLSIIAPYITSAHGGIVIADSNFELTNESYSEVASGYGTGPWHEEKLHNFTNWKVNYVLKKLNETLEIFNSHQMLDDYLNGPAWLAILAGANMVPMYYYSPSQQGIYEKGLASDNPYSLNWSLSVGRIIGWDVQDVSLLIARTLFYQDICDQPLKKTDWHNRFSFVFGEGFGETGGIFHQIPYSNEIKKYGFYTRVFGDFRNSRQMAQIFNTYTGSNYIEYLGHGDWFWYTPSMYGLDIYSRAIDVAHAKSWNYEKPSIFLTSACLMGRIDGIPPFMNIGLTMIHAGCNCFVGATRTTGSEAGLSTFENHLIIDDFSVGEALRGEKRIDKEPPNYYVRVLYGDPAFNPYEPNNGFSNQGRPGNYN